MIPAGIFVVSYRSVFLIAHVFVQPDIKPLFERCFILWDIRSAVDLRGDCGKLLSYLLLRLAVDGFLNLFSRSGINAKGIARLPAPVRALTDRAAALGSFCFSRCQ